MVETEDEWRWTDERGVQRIVTTDELRAALVSGVLPPSTLVWREGMTAWVPASTLPPFRDARPPGAESEAAPAAAEKAPAEAARKARPEMQTLVGLKAVDGEEDRGSAPPLAPIVVPHGENETKRSAITKIPSFGEHAPMAVPSAPKVPEVPDEPAAKAPPRAPAPPPKDSVEDVTLVADNPTKPFRPKAPPAPKAEAKQPAVSKTLHGVGLVGDLPKIPKAPALGSLAEPAAKASPPKPPPKPRALEAAAQALEPKASPPGEAKGAAPPAKPPDRPRSIPPPLPPRARLPSKPPPPKAPEKTPAPPKREVPKPPQRPRPPEPREDTTTHTLPRAEPKPAKADATPPAKVSAGQEAPPADTRAAGQGQGTPPAAEAAKAAPPADAVAAAEAAEPRGASKPSGPITTTLVLPEGALPPPTDPATEPLPPEAAAPAAPAEPAAAPEPAAPEPAAPEPAAQEPAAPEPAAPAPPAEPDAPRGEAAAEEELDLSHAAALAGRTGKLPRLRDPVVVPGSSLWGGAAALVALAVVGFFAGRCSATEEPAVALAGFGKLVPRGVAAPAPAPEKKELRPCYVVRNPLVAWASEVYRQIPFEVGVIDGNIAVGYAKDEKQAAGVLVSPQTGKIVERFAEEKEGPVGFVAPFASGAAKFTILAAPKDDDAVRLQALVPAATPFVLAGRRDGTLATLDPGGASAQDLVGADGEDKAPDALRVRAAGERFAFVFRRAGKVRAGWLGADRKLVGAAAAVPGSGGPVGKPGVAWNGAEVAVIFADRKDDAAPWEIRIGHAAGGEVPKETAGFPLPAGGPGGDAFAPDLLGLSDGRWLLVWTEGSEGSRAVRAQTLDPKLAPLGDPLALSPPAGSYGQGMLVGTGGYVAAVFLSKGAKAYELWGAVLQCG